MSFMGDIEMQDIRWFACRVKRKQAGGIRTVKVGGDFETYRDRQGRVRKRRVNGTGDRVFLPELLLRRAGFEVFLPVKKRLCLKNRFGREKHLVSYPLLVDWLFVGWPATEARWHELMELDVIAGVMGTGGRPVEIRPDRVMRLMRQWGGGHLSPSCQKFLKTGREFSVGDRVRVIDGPLGGFQAKVLDIAGSSVKAEIEILGGDVVADIRYDMLAAIDTGKV